MRLSVHAYDAEERLRHTLLFAVVAAYDAEGRLRHTLRLDRRIQHGVPTDDQDPTKAQMTVLIDALQQKVNALPLSSEQRAEVQQSLSAMKGGLDKAPLAEFVDTEAARPGVPALRKRGPVPWQPKAVETFVAPFLSPSGREATSNRALARS